MANPLKLEDSKNSSSKPKNEKNSNESNEKPEEASDKEEAKPLKAEKKLPIGAQIAIGVGVSLGSIIAAPFALPGIASGSIAAATMSASAASGAGGIVAGSIFAARATFGAGAGALIGIFTKVKCTPEDLKTIFKDHDSNGDGILTPEEFLAVLKFLEIELDEEELKKVYKKATGNDEIGNLTLEEFLKMF